VEQLAETIHGMFAKTEGLVDIDTSLEADRPRTRLTEAGFLVSDALFVELL